MPVVVPVASPVSSTTVDATSFDGRVRAIDDPKFGGVRIKLDYSLDLSSWSSPFRCTVYRENADGTVHTVRGGDPYLNYSGKGWLYDQEAPLGQAVSYYAVPVDSTGALAQQSASAAITTSAPTGGYMSPDMWLVNLEDPSASIQARGTSTLGGSYNGRNDKQTVLGSPYPVVTPDTRNGLGTSISVLTVGQAEFLAMQKLLNQTVIMRKSSLWERPDGYFTVDDVSYAAQSANTGRGVYLWQLGLIEVSRPNTYGQTVATPTFTFAASTAQAPLFSDLLPLPFDAIQGGNMMDAYTSEGESGSAPGNGWNSYNGNTTILRTTALPFRGAYSRRLTATAAGLIGATGIPQYRVTPGLTYTYSMWVNSATGLVTDLLVDWLDGAGNYLTTDSLSEWGRTVTLTPLTWTKVVLSVTPPPGTSLAICNVVVTATAAGQQAYFDAVSMENI
jgi:hypothetical protein